MNRVVVWVLGVISSVMLFFGIVMFGAMSSSYGASASCSSPGVNPPPCTPTLQQVTVGGSLGDGAAAGGLMLLLLAILIGLPAWVGSPILARRRGASSRTAILIVSILASALLIVSVVSAFFTPALFTPETCINGSDPQVCYYGGQATLVALAGIALPAVLSALLVGMPAWVMALTETAQSRRWRWFTVILLFSPIAAMLYGFRGAQRKPPASAPTPTLASVGA